MDEGCATAGPRGWRYGIVPAGGKEIMAVNQKCWSHHKSEGALVWMRQVVRRRLYRDLCMEETEFPPSEHHYSLLSVHRLGNRPRLAWRGGLCGIFYKSIYSGKADR